MTNEPVRNFGELSAEEKQELIDAFNSGRDIEMFVPALNEFHWTRRPMFLADCAYRIAL
jgi:hypothetical protein